MPVLVGKSDYLSLKLDLWSSSNIQLKVFTINPLFLSLHSNQDLRAVMGTLKKRYVVTTVTMSEIISVYDKFLGNSVSNVSSIPKG